MISDLLASFSIKNGGRQQGRILTIVDVLTIVPKKCSEHGNVFAIFYPNGNVFVSALVPRNLNRICAVCNMKNKYPRILEIPKSKEM